MFIAIEVFLYISFLYLDITHHMAALSSILKFLSVCLCYLATDSHKSPIKTIMALTVAADFLLVLTPYYSFGILLFIAVQTKYYQYITKKACFPLLHLSEMVAAGFVIALFINFAVMPIDFKVFLSAVYFLTLVNNILLCASSSLTEYRRLSVCLILIMCCDIHVGITNVFSSGLWYRFGLIAMWLFYLPSQVMIALLYGTNSQNLPYLKQTH